MSTHKSTNLLSYKAFDINALERWVKLTVIKVKMKSIYLFLVFCMFVFINQGNANEIRCNQMLIDRKPLSISWVQEGESSWMLKAIFEKAVIKTYFIKGPPSKGMGLSIQNKPIKQEFEYYPKGFGNPKKIFQTDFFEYTQCLNGAKIISFKFENQTVLIDGVKYELMGTSVIDEVGEGEDSVCYTFIIN